MPHRSCCDACCVAQAFGAGGLTGAEARAHRRARMALLELMAAYLVSVMVFPKMLNVLPLN